MVKNVNNWLLAILIIIGILAITTLIKYSKLIDEFNNYKKEYPKEIIIYKTKVDSLNIRKDAEQTILHNMSDSDAVALFYKYLSDK